MSVNLERLDDGSPAARNFLKLASLVIGTGERELELRWGVSALSMTAQVNNNAGLVTHGMSRAPVVVIANGTDANGFVNVTIRAITSTQFAYSLAYVDGTARTATETIYWIAIG